LSGRGRAWMRTKFDLLCTASKSFSVPAAKAGEILNANLVAAQLAAHHVSKIMGDDRIQIRFGMTDTGRPHAAAVKDGDDTYTVSVDIALVENFSRIMFLLFYFPGIVDSYCRNIPSKISDQLPTILSILEDNPDLWQSLMLIVVKDDKDWKRRTQFIKCGANVLRTMVFLHEACHAAYGHLDFLQHAALTITGPKPVETLNAHRRALEYLADAEAVFWSQTISSGQILGDWKGRGIRNQMDSFAAGAMVQGTAVAVMLYHDERSMRGGVVRTHPEPIHRIYAILRALTPRCAVSDPPDQALGSIMRLGIYTGFRRAIGALRRLDPDFDCALDDVLGGDIPCAACCPAARDRYTSLRASIDGLRSLGFDWTSGARATGLRGRLYGNPVAYLAQILDREATRPCANGIGNFARAYREFDRRY